MSKAQLKKELKAMSHEQVCEMLLDVYSAIKPARDYFEFFLNPDVEKLTEKYKKTLYNEIWRVKRHVSKARISKIKGALKEYASYGIDPRDVNGLRMWVIHEIVRVLRAYWTGDTLFKGMGDIYADVLADADTHGFYSEQIKKLNDMLTLDFGYINYVNYLRRQAGLPIIPTDTAK
ncbi:MAG: hypothetical protein J6C44_04315 [Muribaculaceae bacterium]|nr:hypothetical protein [Muribaculaceae bacterium]